MIHQYAWKCLGANWSQLGILQSLRVNTRTVGRVSDNGLGDWGSIPCWFIQKKLYLMPSSLTFSNIRYGWRERPREKVAPFPTPRYSSYLKGSFRIILGYGRQLSFFFLTLRRKLSWFEKRWTSPMVIMKAW